VAKTEIPPGRNWLLRLQSAFVLPLARTLYLSVALLSLIVGLGATAVLLWAFLTGSGQPTLQREPPPYQGSAVAPPAVARTLDLDTVRRHVGPPTDIRFVITSGPFSAPPPVGEPLGYFVAESPNGVADHPDGVSVLGGPDAGLLERIQHPGTGRTGLAANQRFVERMREDLAGITAPQRKSYGVRVIARDRFAIASEATDVTFELELVPPTAAPASPSAPPVTVQATALQGIAGDIARTLQPEVNPEQFRLYNRALQVPGECQAADDDGDFLTGFRDAFNELKPRLSAANVEALYSGVCAAWADVRAREEQALAAADAAEDAAYRRAEDAREAVRQRNQAALEAHERRVFQAKAAGGVALLVIGGALSAFLSVSLVLAFLAIEGHSRAVRTAVEAIARANSGAMSAPDTATSPGTTAA
jgi:hypothetical protein